jgi:cytochrome P450
MAPHRSASSNNSLKVIIKKKESPTSKPLFFPAVTPPAHTFIWWFVDGLAMIEAGSETTSGTLNSALLHLVANPQCIKRAYQELSRVIPAGRAPTFDDEPQLPYIRSIVKEILRLKPVAAIGSPHYTTDDVLYKDMWIPKGTIVTVFQWAIHADPTRWDEPEKFMPERYLDVINPPLSPHLNPHNLQPFPFSLSLGKGLTFSIP